MVVEGSLSIRHVSTFDQVVNVLPKLPPLYVRHQVVDVFPKLLSRVLFHHCSVHHVSTFERVVCVA